MAGVVGPAIGWAVFAYLEPWFTGVGAPPLVWFCGFIILASLVSGLMLTSSWLFLRSYSRSQRVVWVACSVMAGAFITVVIPLPPVPVCQQLEIIATGEKSPASKGSEVWIQALDLAGGSQVPYSQFQLDRGWEYVNHVLVSYRNQPASLVWTACLWGTAHLHLSAHPFSGVAKIVWMNQTQTVNLYAPASGEKLYDLVPPAGGPWDSLRIALAYSGAIVGLGLCVLAASLWLVARTPGTAAAPARANPWRWLGYALPCAGVWSLYLLAFWPGILSQDSIDQWGQMLQGHLIDKHPAFHTMLLWLITRLWLSPAAVALVQIALMAAIVGLGLAWLRSNGVPAWVTWVVCALVAGSLVNGLMVVTLWKDILFTISDVALTLLVLSLVRSGPQRLHNIAFLVGLASVGLLVALLRHNGPLVAFGTLGILICAYPRYWLRLGAVLACVVALWLGIRGPFYRALQVEPMPTWFALQPVMDDIGIFVSGGAIDRLDAPSRQLLNALHPLADGWNAFDCRLPFAFMQEQMDLDVINKNSDRLTRINLALMVENPGFLIRRLFDCNSVVWRISQPEDGLLLSANLALDSAGQTMLIIRSPNPVGLQTRSRLPELESWLSRVYFLTQTPSVIGWVWRPALYTYLLCAGTLLAAVRLRNWRYLLLLAPALLTTLLYLLLPISSEFRYHYVVILDCLLLALPLQFILPPRAWSNML